LKQNNKREEEEEEEERMTLSIEASGRSAWMRIIAMLHFMQAYDI